MPENNMEGMEVPTLSVLNNVMEAKRGHKAVFAVAHETKKHWWSRRTPYAVAPVLFWATVTELVGDAQQVADEVMVPIVRINGRLRPAIYVPGYVGFVRPGERESLYKEEAQQVRQQWLEAKEEAQKKAEEETRLKERININ